MCSGPSKSPICHVLSMACYLICHPIILNRECNLLEGVSQYEQIFLGIVNNPRYTTKFLNLWMPPKCFGAHLILKGTVTFVFTGTTLCHAIASICLCAYWALPVMMKHDIRHEAPSDQFAGMSICGRQRLSKDFTKSCPYFELTSCSEKDQAESEHTIDTKIRKEMPLHVWPNNKIFCLSKSCVVSLVYQRKYLDDNIHCNNKVSALVFCTELIFLSKYVTTK